MELVFLSRSPSDCSSPLVSHLWRKNTQNASIPFFFNQGFLLKSNRFNVERKDFFSSPCRSFSTRKSIETASQYDLLPLNLLLIIVNLDPTHERQQLFISRLIRVIRFNIGREPFQRKISLVFSPSSANLIERESLIYSFNWPRSSLRFRSSWDIYWWLWGETPRTSSLSKIPLQFVGTNTSGTGIDRIVLIDTSNNAGDETFPCDWWQIL